MLTLALSLPLLFQGAPVHADLHPKNADVYLELGDSAVLWPALDQAPVARFLRDPDMKALFGALGPYTEGTLQDTLLGLLTKAQPEWKAETWFKGLKNASFSMVALGPETETRASFGSLTVLDFSAPEQTKAFEAALAGMATKVEPHATLSGFQRLTTDKASAEQWCLAEGTRFVLGNSGSLPEDYSARAAKKSEGLSKVELFQKFAKLEPPKGTPLGWMMLARPLADIVAAMTDSSEGPASVLKQLPSDLNPFATPKVARLQMVGGRYITEMLAPRTAGDSDKTVDPAWLDSVPAEAMLVYATPFDGVAAGKTLSGLLGQSEEAKAALASVEQKLGFGLERVFTHLGPGMTVYMGALASLGLPEARAYVDCADPAAFTKDLEAFVNALAETMPGVGAKTKSYKVKPKGAEEKVEIPITTISLPPEFSQNPMMSISPSFAPAGGKLVFALNSMDVKSDLKRFIGGENGGVVAGAHPLAKAGFQVPAGAQSVVMMDWAKLLSGVIDLAKAFAPMMGAELPIDLNKLPSKEKVAAFFAPTFHYARLTENGVYRRNEGSFGPETWFGIVGGAFMARAMMPSPSDQPFDLETGEELEMGGDVEVAPDEPK